jgi:hypothetical protein
LGIRVSPFCGKLKPPLCLGKILGDTTPIKCVTPSLYPAGVIFWFAASVKNLAASGKSSGTPCPAPYIYCITSHSQAVREFSGGSVLGDILMVNYREANLTPRQRAILDHAWKMTSAPGETGEADRQCLVDAGLSPEEIFDVNDVIAYFNYTNRMTHGLGMQPNEYNFGRNRLPDPEAD